MAALTPKEVLCQEENITSKTSARSHLNKENKAKNSISLCLGKARERATQTGQKWRLPCGSRQNEQPKWSTRHVTGRGG